MDQPILIISNEIVNPQTVVINYQNSNWGPRCFHVRAGADRSCSSHALRCRSSFRTFPKVSDSHSPRRLDTVVSFESSSSILLAFPSSCHICASIGKKSSWDSHISSYLNTLFLFRFRRWSKFSPHCKTMGPWSDDAAVRWDTLADGKRKHQL